MTYQSVPPTSRLSSSKKGQHHLLLLRGICYLLPLGLFSGSPLGLINGGIALAQSSSNSEDQALPSLNQEQSSSSSLEPIQASNNQQKPATPDYESVPPMEVNASDTAKQASSTSESQSSQTPASSTSPSQSSSKQASSTSESQSSQTPASSTSPSQSSSKQASSTPQSQSSQGNSKLEPIQPLNSSNSKVPQVSSQATTSESVTNSGKDASTPTVEFEQRNSKQATPQPEQQPSKLPKIDNSRPTEASSGKTATQDFVDVNGSPQAGQNGSPGVVRESNCTTVVENGKLLNGSCPPSQDNAQDKTESNRSEPANVKPEKLPSLPKTAEQPNSPKQSASSNQEPVRRTYTPPKDLPQLKLPGNQDSALLFPLSKPSAISANYGWRLHPIVGERHFHTGTDFIAPEGTPVVATKSGRVSLANYHNGYGLMVGIRHSGGHESRYAHLSQIHVKPGQRVEQGTVIGRVGSTGLSTGPHLHFEWRVRKGSRWVAVNAQDQLLAARANMDSSQVAFRNGGDANNQVKGGNFLANLPEIAASLPKQPASWMSVPQLNGLNNRDFDRAYERQAALNSSSQDSQSVLVSPFSLPKVLASIFNWKAPQLFAEQTLPSIPTQQQANLGKDVAYQPPSSQQENAADKYHQLSQFLGQSDAKPKTLESVTNMKALGELNFSSPHQQGNSQKLADSSLKDSHVLPEMTD